VDRAHLREHGYVVVEQAVERAHVDALLGVLREHAGLDVGDPATWDWGSFSPPIWGHQAQWDVRQHAGVYGAFVEAYEGHEALLVSIDGMGFKPPEQVAATRAAAALPIHWDRDPRDERRVFQGVLYLTDVAADGGAFCGVPGVFEDLAGWVERHPDAGLGGVDLEGHEIVPVPGRAGDLVVFDARLPHGNGANLAGAPRAAQYLGYWPAGVLGDDPADVAELYRSGMAPSHLRTRPGWDAPQPWPPAELSPLGRRLAGLDAWA
jgi:ectoine hydroxylase-related dioxygenase (phytanoyl-CoA dioxygenase family)